MALSKVKFKKKFFIQLSLLLMGCFLIFFTYFYSTNQENTLNDKSKKETEITEENLKNTEKTNIFEDVEYRGKDQNGNEFFITSEYSSFEVDKPEKISMTNIVCYFYFKDGTTLEIQSETGTYNNINFDMQFENNVKMFYLGSTLFSDRADFKNDQNRLLVEGNVTGVDPKGKINADRLNFDIVDKKLTISMYNNEDRVNLKTKLK